MASTRNTDTVDLRSSAGSHGRPPRRRLTARSVIASTLLGLKPPELATSALVAGAELLGVSPGTARVAISRMVASGELTPTAAGYRLSGHLLDRQARQDLSRTGATGAWDGDWRTAIVPAEARGAADRVELRRAMTALRFGELRDGVWLRPANLATGALRWAEAVADAQTTCIIGRADDPAGLVERLWDLEGWTDEAASLLDELEPLQARLDASDATALADGFIVEAAVLRHLQADPLLPPTLLPARWNGPALRTAQERFDRSFRAVLRSWHLAHR